MKHSLYLTWMILFTGLNFSATFAGVFMGLSVNQIKIETPATPTKPTVLDYRLGYEIPGHQFQLGLMTSFNDDNLNQLTVDVSSVRSVFYYFSPNYQDDFIIHLILGASQVNIDSTYPGTPDSSDTFESASFGIGFEEAFDSIPALKLKFEYIRLYHGDDLDINSLGLGVRYDF